MLFSRFNVWIGVLITLLIGGFLFYALATAHKHIEDNEDMIEIINDTQQSTQLEKKDPTKKNQNLTVKNILNIFKNKLKKPKVLEQKKIILNYSENKNLDKLTNQDVVGLYLFEDIGNSILYTYGMLVAVSLPKVPSGWAIRILTGWWWMYCLLVVVAYKASMTAILANPDTRLILSSNDIQYFLLLNLITNLIHS